MTTRDIVVSAIIGRIRAAFHRAIGHNALEASDGWYCAGCGKDW